jgi:ornithine cyclodeaminase
VHEIGGAVTSLVMPAWTPGGHYGVKIVNVAAGNVERGLPALHASYLLHDARTGYRSPSSTATRSLPGVPQPPRRSPLVAGPGGRPPPAGGRVPAGSRAAACRLSHRRPIERVTVWARRAAEAEALAQA